MSPGDMSRTVTHDDPWFPALSAAGKRRKGEPDWVLSKDLQQPRCND
ncbi:hypothetical protein RvY_10241 [Ramazzottius varieornatus]|uniref:Uncharacterized protein n=1 Tax=Ramazzottius varieornatus TaxID=947166 RepID=A0A1D1VL57_RAMVA|nr:hypothetical protein RvY_10241 [Ramazzottius varieornatus]